MTRARDVSNIDGLLTTKGDIYAATGAGVVVRQGVGSDGQVLTANSALDDGLEWATASSGGLTLITEVVLSASTGYSFTSIPSTYKQLLLIWGGIQHSAISSQFAVRLNANSGTVYQQSSIRGSTSTFRVDTGNRVSISDSESSSFGQSATSTGGSAVQGTLLIDNYSSSTQLKRYNCVYGYNDIENSVNRFSHINGTFNSTTEITSIDITRTVGTATISNVTNTSVRLYGVS